jgi:hypothetical protein
MKKGFVFLTPPPALPLKGRGAYQKIGLCAVKAAHKPIFWVSNSLLGKGVEN